MQRIALNAPWRIELGVVNDLHLLSTDDFECSASTKLDNVAPKVALILIATNDVGWLHRIDRG